MGHQRTCCVSCEPCFRCAQQAIERNERGRKVQGRGRARTALPSYFRLVRPGTGYAGTDIDREVSGAVGGVGLVGPVAGRAQV
jgi:hypothetical protein